MRAALIAVVAAALAVVPAAGAATSFVVTGHGFGHGIGLSQYGAYGYAQHGWTPAQILRHYYRGSTIGTVPSQPVRVLLADGRASVQVSSEQPISVVDSAGQWEVLPAGTYTLRKPLTLPGWPAQTPPMPPVSFDAGAAQLTVDGKPYRGSVSVGATASRLSVVNTVPLESYLLGVVPREMPASWAPEALRAQAVAARSYALASLHPTSTFDVYADTRSQVYGGASGEDARTTAAVQATAGQVVLWHGQVAETFFHSSSGGRTATVTDVWPAAQPLPYLVSVSDPYDSVSPYHDWAPLTFTAAGAARRLGVPGLKRPDRRDEPLPSRRCRDRGRSARDEAARPGDGGGAARPALDLVPDRRPAARPRREAGHAEGARAPHRPRPRRRGGPGSSGRSDTAAGSRSAASAAPSRAASARPRPRSTG